jgi:hypothetical protein
MVDLWKCLRCELFGTSNSLAGGFGPGGGNGHIDFQVMFSFWLPIAKLN